MDTKGKFYLGRVVEAGTGEQTERPLHYDPDDLNTHAVIVGMTGSGKTGLCLDLLEEAALNNVPALMIDPKGDITNALLHFPELLPTDFQPWINANEARQEGKSVEQAATETADLWRNGLAGWDITSERIQALKESAQFAIYTPGSDAGLPLSILASLQAPTVAWQENRETLREKISSTVTGLLGLVGLKNIDPVRSREHILLANIFEQAWSQGQDLDLGQLILQTQSPPFSKLGVFDVNTFFPEKDRFELAMMLNNILAAPSFQAWVEGEALDVGRLLWTADGRPRHTIFYIAHLSESERMFFVTLLYAAVETWMRGQQGSPSLRALVYFDEIFGYLPPVANPPSKQVMLRLLKQARAFGVGMVLATQNPADIDYKALSNAGSWFIGKLATEQDKNRLLDGLTSTGSSLDRGQYDDLISQLDKRVFLLRNVHESQPELFHTRWAMNYLAGPLMRTQIRSLNTLAGAQASPEVGIEEDVGVGSASATSVTPETKPQEVTPPPTLPATRPTLPRGVEEYFLPVNRPFNDKIEEIVYQPTLLAQAEIWFTNRKYDLDDMKQRTTLVVEVAEHGRLSWDEFEIGSLDTADLPRDGISNGRFNPLSAALKDSQLMRSLKTDFVDWVYRTTEATVQANEKLKVYAGPDTSETDFEQKCLEAARPKMETEIDKLEAKFDKREAAIEKKLAREERELEQDKEELSARKRQETVTHAETIFSLFSRRKRSLSSSMSKRRMTQRAKADVEESEETIQELEREIEQLEMDEEEALVELRQKWQDIIEDVTEIGVKPYKKDVKTAVFGIAWFPYCMVNGKEVAGFVTE